MLLNYNQFLLLQGVRSSAHLLSPRVIESADIALPRNTVLHYLDYRSEEAFPERVSPYLQNVRSTKRVPLWNITALERTNDTTVLANRTLDKQVRAWRKAHAAQFRLVNLLEIPNTDIQTHSVLNYQLLNSLYRYKSSATAALSRYRNVHATYWQGVKNAIAADPSAEQFVRLPVPSLIPSKAMLDNILKQSVTVYARVIQDPDLNGLVELYRYLSVQSRPSSLMGCLQEEDCERITVEFTHKGYSCFFKLSHLVSLSEESELASKRKLSVKQLQRMLLLIALKIQQKVCALQDDTPAQTAPDQEEDAVQEEQESLLNSGAVGLSRLQPGAARAPEDDSMDEDDLLGVELAQTLEIDIAELEGGSDDLFAKLMSKAIESPVLAQKTAQEPDRQEGEAEQELTLQTDYSDNHAAELLRDKSVDENLESYLQEAKLSGGVSTVEIRALRKLSQNRKALRAPYSDALLDEYRVVSSQDTAFDAQDQAIEIDNDLVDDALKSEKMFSFDRLYLDKLYRKDVIGCVSQLEKAGIVIKDYQVEQNDSALGSYEVHKLTLKPYKGKESTVYFRLPVVDAEGEFMASGVKYRMRKARQDLPLRKVSPSRVGVTSNYGKLFINRTERKSYDPYAQMADFVKKEYLSGSGLITSVTPGNCFDNHAQRPNVFMALSREFRQFSTPEYTFIFQPEEIANAVPQETLDSIEKSGQYTVVGYAQADKTLLVMDGSGDILRHGSTPERLGSMAKLLQMDTSKVPVQFATIKVLGDTLALGVVMAYYLGLKGLLEVTRTTFTLYGPRQNPARAGDDIVIRLQDHKVVIDANTPLKKLLFGGFAFYKDALKTVELEALNTQAVYLSILEQRGSGLMHLRELDLLRQLFLDPITVDVLRSMKEPTEYLPLLMRACEMLATFSHPDINDPTFSRIRGYDRVPGLMYRVLSQSVRSAKMGMTRGKVELDPYGVWNAITQDTTVKVVEDSNPITDIKETEAVTFSGADGLSKNATPEKIRRYHKKDIGLVSEATVDSTDVALNIYLTPYAKLENLRGRVTEQKQERQDTVFSTSVMLSPMAEHDDPKRINFINIQNGHTIAAAGYEQPMLRTGYEYLMPYKVGSLYCNTAPEPGVVTSLSDKQLKVKFKSGVEKTYGLGDTYGRMEGSVYLHRLVTDLVSGQKFAAGEYLTYNTGYFERDWLDSSKLVMKFSKNITVALSMGDEVYEDSSSISKKLGEALSTKVVTERSFIIDFDKNILELKAEGEAVDVNDSLFTLADGSSDYSNLSSSSIDLLKSISNLSPKARVKGEVFRYEMKYNGEASDMSPTLKKLALRLDKQTQLESESRGVVVRSNRVTSEYRCEGKNLMPRTLELKVMITYQATQAHADKGVFGSQMKSVISDVFRSTITTDSGTEIQALFSYRSILNRTALSPLLMGTTNRLLRHISPMIADAYFN